MRTSWRSFAAAFLAAAAGCGNDGPPRIEFDRTAHHFGSVRQNAEVTTTFRVENRGGAALLVKGVSGDCGCETATISAREIAPGGEATLTVVFRTHAQAGPLRKHVTVESDDPARPRAVLGVSVDVEAGVVLHPSNFFFDTVLVGTPPTARIVAKWKDGVGRPFQVTAVEASGALAPGIEFVREPFEEPPWHGTAITMRFSRPPTVGTMSGRAVIRTDDPEFPALSALVGGTVSGKVWIARREASFGMLPKGKGGLLRVPLHGFDASVNLGTVTAKARGGRVTATAVRDPGDPREWAVEVSLPAGAPEGEVSDVVEVSTAVPGEETIEVKVTGWVVAR